MSPAAHSLVGSNVKIGFATGAGRRSVVVAANMAAAATSAAARWEVRAQDLVWYKASGAQPWWPARVTEVHADGSGYTVDAFGQEYTYASARHALREGPA